MNVLGIDIGGSGIKGAIVDTETGQALTEPHRVKTPEPATPDAVIAACARLLEHFSWSGPIGVGFPGVVKAGTIHTAANLDKSCIGVNFRELLEKRTGCPSALLNDADAVGLAETQFGAGREFDYEVALVITLGTGIGSALIVGNHVVPNTEFGHVYYKDKVIWEKYAADSARKREDLTWPEWGKRVNKLLKEMVRLMWPDLIIIGGGASKRFSRFEDQLTVNVPVVPAQLLNMAGIFGAALYVEQALATEPLVHHPQEPIKLLHPA